MGVTESNVIISIASFAIGFLVNLVVMRGYFCSMKECGDTRESCEKERDARWEAIEHRLTSIEKCLGELKTGCKENYKALCDIKSAVVAMDNNHVQRTFSGGV